MKIFIEKELGQLLERIYNFNCSIRRNRHISNLARE